MWSKHPSAAEEDASLDESDSNQGSLDSSGLGRAHASEVPRFKVEVNFSSAN